MIDTYRAGIPGNGELFPDGSKLAKIHWNAKKSAEAPDPTIVPDTLHDIDFMVKDSKRFPDTGGWGYAEFICPRIRHIHAPWERDQLRVRMPYDREGKGLRFHDVREAMNGVQRLSLVRVDGFRLLALRNGRSRAALACLCDKRGRFPPLFVLHAFRRWAARPCRDSRGDVLALRVRY